MAKTRIESGRSGSRRRYVAPARGNWIRSPIMAVVGVLGVVGLAVVLVDSRNRVTEGDQFLRDKDALIAEFRGFLDRAEDLEEECHGDLEASIPGLPADAVVEAERRGDIALGKEKIELLQRRRAELFVLFVPDPDTSRNRIVKRRGRLQASEKQWRALYLERHELRLRELREVSKRVAQERAARKAVLAKAGREQAARRRSRQRVSDAAELGRSDVRLSQSRASPPALAEVRTDPSPPKASKAELFVQLIDGSASEADVLRYEAMVFPSGVPTWAENLRFILRQGDVVTPNSQAIEALSMAVESGDDQRMWLAPYVVRAVEAGVENPRLHLNAAELLCLPSKASDIARAATIAADLADQLQAGIDLKEIDRFAVLLDRVPAGARFRSNGERAEWMASALRAAITQLRGGTPLVREWLQHERDHQLEKVYVTAVRAGDQKGILQCAAAWESLDSGDPTPHLLVALTMRSLSSSSGARAAKARDAASLFEKLRERDSDPGATVARMQRLGLLAVFDQLKMPQRDVVQAIKLPASLYAFPQRSILKRKIRAHQDRVDRLDRDMANQQDSIKKLRRQLSRVSPNDRRYILNVKVPEHEGKIQSFEKKKADKQVELELARGAQRRMEEFSIGRRR